MLFWLSIIFVNFRTKYLVIFGAVLLLVSIFVVDADEGAREGQYLTEGDQHRVVYLSHRRGDEARDEHHAPEGAQCDSEQQLQMLSPHTLPILVGRHTHRAMGTGL